MTTEIPHPDNFSHMIGTVRTDHRGLSFRVDRVRYCPGGRFNKPCVSVQGRVISTQIAEGFTTPERPSYNNSTWLGAHAADLFYENPNNA